MNAAATSVPDAPVSAGLERVRVVAAGRLLLQGPELTVGCGERVAIVGPNGAGERTLLRLLAGMVRAADGHIEVLGRAIGPQAPAPMSRHEWRRLRSEVELVMQGLHLGPRLTARENVLVGALGRLQGRDAWRSWLRWYSRDLAAEADQALTALGLAERADTRADRLSGGERQKVSLARLQMQRPRLVLADEPTSALDPSATALVCDALLAAVAAPGHTLVTEVHDLDLLPVLATRVIGIVNGRVQWDRPMAEVDRATLAALYGQRPAPAEAPRSGRRHATFPSWWSEPESDLFQSMKRSST